MLPSDDIMLRQLTTGYFLTFSGTGGSGDEMIGVVDSEPIYLLLSLGLTRAQAFPGCKPEQKINISALSCYV